MSYQPVDQKKEDFRKYLEKNGIIESLTKALVGLYEESEKPENPLEYLQQLLNGGNSSDIHSQLEQLRAENQQLKERIAELEGAQMSPVKEEEDANSQPAVEASPPIAE